VTTYDVYLGELGPDGALDWGGEPNIGNIPKRIGPFFPAYGLRTSPYEMVVDQIGRGVLDGKKVDWGSHAARVTVAQLSAFVAACYGSGVPVELAMFLATLDVGRSYALVACEL
jgi:hypothetical protein